MKDNNSPKQRWLVTVFFSYWWYVACASLAVVFIAYYLKTEQQTTGLHAGKTYSCDLIRVIDGDSIIVRCHQETFAIRLQYIDAPELGQAIWGEKAKHYLQQQLPATLQINVHGQDVYQRYLATLNANQHNINLMMVTSGFARVYRRYQPPNAYLKAMQTAKQEKLGIWQTNGLHQDPQRWRRLSP